MLESILIPLAVFTMVTLIVWFANVTKRQEQERKAALVRAVIDKYTSAEELTKAMAGPEGQALFRMLSFDEAGPRRPWIALVIPGSVLLLLGLGFVVLAALDGYPQGLMIPGVICAAVGAALLASGYVIWRTGEDGPDEADG